MCPPSGDNEVMQEAAPPRAPASSSESFAPPAAGLQGKNATAEFPVEALLVGIRETRRKLQGD